MKKAIIACISIMAYIFLCCCIGIIASSNVKKPIGTTTATATAEEHVRSTTLPDNPKWKIELPNPLKAMRKKDVPVPAWMAFPHPETPE